MTPDLNARPSRGEAPGLSTARFAGVVTSQKMMAIDPQSDLSPVLRNHRERGSSPLLSLSGTVEASRLNSRADSSGSGRLPSLLLNWASASGLDMMRSLQITEITIGWAFQLRLS